MVSSQSLLVSCRRHAYVSLDKIQKQPSENAMGGRDLLPTFAFHLIKLKKVLKRERKRDLCQYSLLWGAILYSYV
jgi:hypothetical protein